MDRIIKAVSENPKATFGLLFSAGIGYTAVNKLKQFRKEKYEETQRPYRLVVITGCDSGLGLSMAFWAASLGYKVIAGCLDPNGTGAEFLRNFRQPELNSNIPSSIKVVRLDLTDDDTVKKFASEVQEILAADVGKIKLWAVVSNAGVLVCGEFFWQTPEQRERQLKVNYLGPVNLTLAFKSLLLTHKCRLVFVTSECAKYPLPSLSPYAGSKAALEAWACALRREVAKYGVTVVCYQPGNFPQDSQIFATAGKQLCEMKEAMSEDDKEFYGDYLNQWIKIKNEFSAGSPKNVAEPLTCKFRRNEFIQLLEENMEQRVIFRNESDFFEKIFHFIIDYFPRSVADRCVCLAMDNGASWVPKEKRN